MFIQVSNQLLVMIQMESSNIECNNLNVMDDYLIHEQDQLLTLLTYNRETILQMSS